MYRSLTLALAAALMAPLSQAMAEVHLDARCEIDSAYSLKVETSRLVFSRSGSEVAFANGRVFLDGAAVSLSDADSERVLAFEHDVRALVPEVKQIAQEAIDIAFVALDRVVETFASAGNRPSFQSELNGMRAEIAASLARAQSTAEFENGEFEAKIKDFATRMAPQVAGEFAAQAVAAAMSGDENAAKDIEAKAKRLEVEIEASVEAPAKALEGRINALCPRVEALDRLENALDLRLPDGKALDLLEVNNKA